MKIAMVCFLLRGEEICLGLKKRGFGAGKFNGFGGKVGDKEEFRNETIEESAVREGREEFKIVAKDLRNRGELHFVFPHNKDWDQVVHVFLCTNWDGIPQESEEIKPTWFKVSKIPYGEMWDGDKYWLPKVLDGEKIKGSIKFDTEGIVIDHEIQVIGETKEFPERK